MGACVIGTIILVAATHSRSVGDNSALGKPAEQKSPSLTFSKGPNDADSIVRISPPKVDGSATAAWPGDLVLCERDGVLYPQGDAGFTVSQQPILSTWDARLDTGAFFGFRAASRGNATDDVTAGLRISPVRVLYGYVSPDVVVARDWAGGGFSFYLTENLVPRQWTRVGLGAWYGYPYRGPATGGGPGWAIGLSFSTK
jgi:hypothetical protein